MKPDANEARIVQEKAPNPYPVTQKLSLAERKKRQWQKEKGTVEFV